MGGFFSSRGKNIVIFQIVMTDLNNRVGMIQTHFNVAGNTSSLNVARRPLPSTCGTYSSRFSASRSCAGRRRLIRLMRACIDCHIRAEGPLAFTLGNSRDAETARARRHASHDPFGHAALPAHDGAEERAAGRGLFFRGATSRLNCRGPALRWPHRSCRSCR